MSARGRLLINVRRLSRELRYRQLDELIERPVRITSLGAAEHELRALVAPWLLPGAQRREHPLGPAMGKYGLIDATFPVSAALLDHPETRTGIPLLRELGFVSPPDPAKSPPGSPQAIALDDDAGGLLGEWLDDIARGQCFLRLMLHDTLSVSERCQRWPATRVAPFALGADYLPREFVVDDACLTNLDSVWLNKHFYL